MGRRGRGLCRRRWGVAVPQHDGEPAAAVGVHPQGLHHRRPPDRDHHRRRGGHQLNRSGPRLPPRPLDRLVRGRRSHHDLAVLGNASDDVLQRAPPHQLCPPPPLHRLHRLRCWIGMHDSRRHGYTGSCNPNSCGGWGSHSLHILGGQKRPRLQLPRSVLVCGSPCTDHLLPHPGVVSDGNDHDEGVRVHFGGGLRRLHHLRHRQPDQATQLRPVRVCRHLALPRHHQSLLGVAQHHGRLMMATCEFVSAHPPSADFDLCVLETIRLNPPSD